MTLKYRKGSHLVAVTSEQFGFRDWVWARWELGSFSLLRLKGLEVLGFAVTISVG
jgi:hypothetical protein